MLKKGKGHDIANGNPFIKLSQTYQTGTSFGPQNWCDGCPNAFKIKVYSTICSQCNYRIEKMYIG